MKLNIFYLYCFISTPLLKYTSSLHLSPCLLTFSEGSVQACQFPRHNAILSLKISPWWSVVILQIRSRIKSLVAGCHGCYSIHFSLSFHPCVSFVTLSRPFSDQPLGAPRPHSASLYILCLWVFSVSFDVCQCFGLL